MKAILIAIGLLTFGFHSPGAGKQDRHPLLASDTLIWAGLDYSIVRMVGPGEFNNSTAIFPGMLEAWNDLFLQERTRFVEKQTKNEGSATQSDSVFETIGSG